MEAIASTRSIITETTARTITAGFVARSLHDIRAGGAFHKGAVGATTTDVTDTPHMLIGVPRCSIKR